jgi:hypothetical protein
MSPNFRAKSGHHLVGGTGSIGIEKDSLPKIASDGILGRNALLEELVAKRLPIYEPDAYHSKKVTELWKKEIEISGNLLAIPVLYKRENMIEEIYGTLIIIGNEVIDRDISYFAPSMMHLAVAFSQLNTNYHMETRLQIVDLIKAILSNTRMSIDDVTRKFSTFMDVTACSIYTLKPQGRIGVKARNKDSAPNLKRISTSPVEKTADKNTLIAIEHLNFVLADNVLSKTPIGPKGLSENHLNDLRHVSTDIRPFVGQHDFLGVPIWNSARKPIGAITMTRAKLLESNARGFNSHDIALTEAVAEAIGRILERNSVN